MQFRGFVTVILVSILLISATSAFALDGTRKGFILSFGIGPGMTSLTSEYGSQTSDRENKFAVATDFKIGGGISEQFTIYYINRVSWLSFETEICTYDFFTGTISCVKGDNITIAHAIGLVGASYYFQPEAPSPYVLGSVGISTWSAPFEENSETWTGLGLSGGFGYEFAAHWALEATLNYGKPGENDASINALSVLVTVGGTLY
jgi:hypothetical protein